MEGKETKEIEGIVKIDSVWRAERHEPNTKLCRQNFRRRIPMLSKANDFGNSSMEWFDIIGEKIIDGLITENVSETSTLCICGMKIKYVYYAINESTKEIAQIGNTCIDSINKGILMRWEQQKIRSGTCSVCEKNGNLCYFPNVDKHLKSAAHAKKYQKFSEKRTEMLKDHIKKRCDEIRTDLRRERMLIVNRIETLNNLFRGRFFENEPEETITIKPNRRRRITRKCITPRCRKIIYGHEPAWKIRCIKCYSIFRKMEA